MARKKKKDNDIKPFTWKKAVQVPKAPKKIIKKYLVGKRLTFKIGRVRWNGKQMVRPC